MARRKRRHPQINVPVASMGDIAFLLIIFFMLVSTFAKDPVTVEQPYSEDIDKVKQLPPIIVSLDAEKQLWLDGIPISSKESLSQSLDDRLKLYSDKRVYFKCDSSLDFTTFQPVIKVIAESGAQLVMSGTPDKTTK